MEDCVPAKRCLDPARAVGVGSAWPVAAEDASRGHSVHIGRPNAGRGAGRRRSAAGSAGRVGARGCGPDRSASGGPLRCRPGRPPFASYACPTILGELKRHFRDSGWNVRAPRRIQELGSRLVVAGDELTQLLHRSPTTTELATRLGVSRDEVLEAQCYATVGRPLTEPLRLPPAPHGCYPAGPIAGRAHRNVTHRG